MHSMGLPSRSLSQINPKTMKNFLCVAFWAALALPQLTWAQAEIEVFSEMGETFTMYLNQKQVNEAASARVLTTVDPGYYMLRIAFQEPGKPDILKKNFGVEAGMRSTGKITLNRKGEYVVRPFGYVPMSQASPEPVTTSPATQTPGASMNTGVHMTVTETTEVGTPAQGTSDRVQMSMNVGGGLIPGGVSMNVDMTATSSVTSTTSTTTTTTTTTASNWGALPGDDGETGGAVANNGMTELDFRDYLESIKAKTFEDSKLATAKAPLQSGVMLTSAQVAQVMGAMTYEDSRLEFAVFAHPRCVDPHNYYKTHGAFEYELSIDDLNGALGQ